MSAPALADVRRLETELADARGQISRLTETVADQAKTTMSQARALAGWAPVPVPLTPTWRELWEAYSVAEADKLESWDTVKGRAKHVLRILGDALASDASVATVRAYRSQRKTETTIRKGLTTATTRNREIELIARMARWASRQRPPLLAPDPFMGIDRSDLFEAVENVRRNVVEDDPTERLSLAKLLDGAEPLDVAIVLTDHSSGMRRRELALLEWGWIDRRERIVDIPPGVSKGRRGKRKGRQTFISAEALDAIDAYHETLPEKHRDSPFVFVSPRGGRYSAGHFSVRFRALSERHDFIGPSGQVTLHDAGRRSFITLARRRGEDTSNIMHASGHRTLKAFERYDIHSMRDAIAVRDRMEAARAEDLSDTSVGRRGPRRSPKSSPDRNNP